MFVLYGSLQYFQARTFKSSGFMIGIEPDLSVVLKDEIEPPTYKKWFKKYSIERAAIMNDISRLREDNGSK